MLGTALHEPSRSGHLNLIHHRWPLLDHISHNVDRLQLATALFRDGALSLTRAAHPYGADQT